MILLTTYVNQYIRAIFSVHKIKVNCIHLGNTWRQYQLSTYASYVQLYCLNTQSSS